MIKKPENNNKKTLQYINAEGQKNEYWLEENEEVLQQKCPVDGTFIFRDKNRIVRCKSCGTIYPLELDKNNPKLRLMEIENIAKNTLENLINNRKPLLIKALESIKTGKYSDLKPEIEKQIFGTLEYISFIENLAKEYNPSLINQIIHSKKQTENKD